MSDQESLPYGGRTNPNSGHAGSDTSRERATRADADGTTSHRQQDVLKRLDYYGPRGMTWREFASMGGLHHGQASGVLSGLHKAGRVERLAETRDRCKVYVLSGYVNGRVTEPYGRTAISTRLDEAASILDALLDERDCDHGPVHEAGCRRCEAKSWLAWHRNLRQGNGS